MNSDHFDVEGTWINIHETSQNKFPLKIVHVYWKEITDAQLDENHKGNLCYIMEGSSTNIRI